MTFLFNTQSRQKEKFTLIKKGLVTLYSCGPTVYDYPHIGNMRSFLLSDLLRKVFEYKNYKVVQVINITDVGHLVSDQDFGEDKLELASRNQKMTAKEIADYFTKVFLRHLKIFNIKKPNFLPKATQHIKEQIELIGILERKGFTYKISDGIYFDTSKLKNYGKLSLQDISDKKAGARIEINKEKKSPFDFALWKFSPKNQTRQMEWGSPWGIGFPGWHIECSAMSTKYLGQPFDIHTGGVDHINVHHENEIAQSESAYDKKLANYWLHGEFLSVNGQKMSKSLGNILTLDDIIKKGFNPLSLRLLFLQTHYRTKMNFTFESLKAAQNSLNNLYLFLQKINFIISSPKFPSNIKNANFFKDKIKEFEKNFVNYIDDDLNLPQALGLIFTFISDAQEKITQGKISLDGAKLIKNFILKTDKVFGIINKKNILYKVPIDLQKLVNLREDFRLKKDFAKSDEIRNRIIELGWQIEDTTYGQFIYIDKSIKID